jgi:hypothetical protein
MKALNREGLPVSHGPTADLSCKKSTRRRGYPKGEADPTSPKPLQAAVLDPGLISQRDFLLATRTHMELDGWPVGSRVYLEKWGWEGLFRTWEPKQPKVLRFRRVDGGTFGVTRVCLVVCTAVTESLRLLLPLQL